MNIVVESPAQKVQEANEITIEQYLKRKIQRRRRVAKRKLKAVPLFAVEEMQGEFPGYTYEEFVADVTRKTRKGKSFRRQMEMGFNWKEIAREIPEFVLKCKVRTKTKALLRGRLKDGTEFTMVIRAVWHGEYGECRLRTHELINLWRRNSVAEFQRHPSTLLYRHNNDLELAQ